jgi:peptide/nickel transport system substrate-binding protein
MASAAGMEVLTGPRDLAAVKRAVAASGYKGEKTVVPVPSDFPNLRALADVGVDMMQKIGINVEARFTDWGSMLQSWRRWTRWSKAAGARSTPIGRVGSVRSGGACVDQRQRQGGGTRGWPDSPRLEALRDEWLFGGRPHGPEAIAEDIQRQVFIDVPYIPLGQILPTWVYQKTVTDVLTGYALFWNVRKL